MAVGRNNVLPRIRTAYTLEGKVALALCQQEQLSGLSVGKGIESHPCDPWAKICGIVG